MKCRTGKRRHMDEVTARAAGSSHLENQRDQYILWVYKCKECGGWHLTSKSQGIQYMVTKDSTHVAW